MSIFTCWVDYMDLLKIPVLITSFSAPTWSHNCFWFAVIIPSTWTAPSCVRPCTRTQKTTGLPWPPGSTGPGVLTWGAWKVRGHPFLCKSTGLCALFAAHTCRVMHQPCCPDVADLFVCPAVRQHCEIKAVLSVSHYRVQDVSLLQRGHVSSLDTKVHSSPPAAAAAVSALPPSPPPAAWLPPQRVHPRDTVRLLHAEARGPAKWAGRAQFLLHLWQEATPSDVTSGGGSHHK